MWLGTDMRILEDYTSQYTFRKLLITNHFDHSAEIIISGTDRYLKWQFICAETAASPPKRPHLPHAEARSCVPYTLCIMPKGVHWPDCMTVPWNNASRNTKGHWLQAPPSLQLLNMRWTPTIHWLGKCIGCWLSPAPSSKMCLGSWAYQIIETPHEQRARTLIPRILYPKPITPSYTLHHFPVLVVLIIPHFLFSTRVNCHFEHLSVSLMMISV